MPINKKVPSTKSQVPNKKTISKETRIKKSVNNLSIPVYSLTGKAEEMTLPKEIFGQKVNKKLLAQAVRVYTTNQKTMTGSTKTRGEVEGSTAKIFRQKGTGRARHGAIRAPIFVGGGIAFGPKPRKVRLDLPKNMRKAALLSALSAKADENKVIGLTGADKATGKTSQMHQLLTKIIGKDKKISSLLVTGEKQSNIARAVRNISGVRSLSANLINAHEVLTYDLLLITKEGLEKFQSKGAVEK